MEQIENFIKKFLNLADKVYNNYKIPVLVTLSQAALESAWGQKAPGNNYFGVKAGSSWAGGVNNRETREIISPEQFKKLKNTISQRRLESGNYEVKIMQPFRAYRSAKESFLDYGRILSTNKRYKKAFSTSNPYDFAKEVSKAGYATSEKYYESLVNIINIIKKNLIFIRQLNLVF